MTTVTYTKTRNRVDSKSDNETPPRSDTAFAVYHEVADSDAAPCPKHRSMHPLDDRSVEVRSGAIGGIPGADPLILNISSM